MSAANEIVKTTARLPRWLINKVKMHGITTDLTENQIIIDALVEYLRKHGGLAK